eukprot:SM000200S05833  [mRNA]  locus=s200:210594:216975:- [translate_table: standard]
MLAQVGACRELPPAQRAALARRMAALLLDGHLAGNARHVATAVQAGAMEDAEAVVAMARAAGGAAVPTVHAYAALIKGYCAADARKAAFAVLTAMEAEGVLPNAVVFNTLLQGEQSLEGVRSLLARMRAADIPLDERSYSAAIRCAGRLGQVTEAEALWHEMRDAGIVQTIYTYNCLIDAHASAGDVEKCRRIVAELEARSMPLQPCTLNILLKAHVRSKDAEGAAEMLKGMQQAGVVFDEVGYNSVLEACVRGRKADRALQLCSDFMRTGFLPSATTFATLLRAAGHLREAAAVNKVLSDMEAAGCPHDQVTYRCAVHAYVRCGEGGVALTLTQQMTAAGYPPAMAVPDVLVRSVDAALMRECTAAAPAGNLHSLLAEMAVAGLSPTAATGGRLVSRMAGSHGPKEAIRLAEELVRRGVTPLGPRAWLAVAQALSAVADGSPLLASWARQLCSLMLEESMPDKVAYEAAAAACAKCGEGESALSIHTALQESLRQQSTKSKAEYPPQRILLDTVNAALTGALASDVVKFKDQCFDAREDDCSRRELLEGLNAAGIKLKPRAVMDIFEQLVTKYPQPGGRRQLAIRRPTAERDMKDASSMKVSELTAIGTWLERAVDLVDALPSLFDTTPTCFVYKSLMEACIKHKQVGRLEPMWRHMRLHGVSPDAATWESRIRGLAMQEKAAALSSVHRNAEGKGRPVACWRRPALSGRAPELLAEAAKDGLELEPAILRALLKACRHVGDVGSMNHVKKVMEASQRERRVA